jgi:hypothetical protein
MTTNQYGGIAGSQPVDGPRFEPGDIVNGHVLTRTRGWLLLAEAIPSTTLEVSAVDALTYNRGRSNRIVFPDARPR